MSRVLGHTNSTFVNQGIPNSCLAALQLAAYLVIHPSSQSSANTTCTDILNGIDKFAQAIAQGQPQVLAKLIALKTALQNNNCDFDNKDVVLAIFAFISQTYIDCAKYAY